MEALFTKLVTPTVMANPIRVNNLVTELSPHLWVDTSSNANVVGSLMFSLRNVTGKDIHTFTLPYLSPSKNADGQTILRTDQAAITAMTAALKNGTLGQYLATAKIK